MPQRFTPGDLLIVRINSLTLSSETVSFLKDVKPIGIHFGKDAFLQGECYSIWLDAYQQLRNEILQVTGRDRMIWSIDHEGGRVVRVPPPMTHFPYPLNWLEDSAAVGEVFGRELSSIGINLLLGPSLDICNDPESGVIGPRSFGRSPKAVDAYVSQFVRALEHKGVLATVKHFPGHGDTDEDSHFDLPVLNKEIDELLDHELRPFSMANDRGVQSIMFAHILFPKIDAEYPSSLSKRFHLDVLRAELGFEGVSMTDDLDMKAISSRYSPKQIALSVVENEINFALFNHSLNHAYSVWEEIGSALSDKPGKAERIARRTATFNKNLNVAAISELDANAFLSHCNLASRIVERFNVHIEEFTGA